MAEIIRKILFKFLIKKSNRRRDKFVEEWIQSLKSGSSLLDAGAGFQRYKKYADHLNYVSQDFGMYEGGEISAGVKVSEWNSKQCDIICDITNIPRDDSSFDYIMCNEVFEHIPNPQLALKELARLLKTGGKILITAPFRCHSHQEPYFFYTGFSEQWYRYFAKENNLEIMKICQSGNYFMELAEELIYFFSSSNFFHQIFFTFLLLPFILFLFIFSRIYSITKNPFLKKSSDGFFVVLKKNKIN